jgi:hypothetical protein
MRYELASPAWLEAQRATLQFCLDSCVSQGEDISALTFSICEVCTDPPPHLGPSDSKVGWHCRVVDGVVVEFAPGEALDVDYRFVTDYASMRQMGAYDTQGDPDRATAYGVLTKSLYDAGKMEIHGRMPRLPRPFGAWHDIMARQTL